MRRVTAGFMASCACDKVDDFSYKKLSREEKDAIIKELLDGKAAVVAPNTSYNESSIREIFNPVYYCASFAEAKAVREDFAKEM